MKMPKSPFATRLSGSAKETELRLRSIFQWKKKRPPAVLFILAVVLLLGICGGLVGFNSSPREGTLSEIFPEYFAEEAVVYIMYEDKEDQGKPVPMPGSNEYAAAMEYLGSTEIRAVWGHKKYIGEFNFRNGAFYLLNEPNEPLKIELYPDGYMVISTGRGQTEDNKNAKVYRAEAFDKEAFLALWPPLDDGADGEVTQPAPDEPENTGNGEEIVPSSQYGQVVRGELSLDENGVGDDSIVLTIYRDDNGPTGQVEAVVHLGSGETLRCDLSNEENYYFLPELVAAHLTSANRQSVIVKLNSIASTYGFAQYYAVEVVDGALYVTDLTAGRETLNDFSLIYHPVTGLARVQIRLLDDEVVILGWTDGVWSEVEIDPMEAYERNKRRATVAGLDHMPLDELPQEILDSLTLVSETDLSGTYTADWGWYRTYTAPGLEIRTSAPSAVYLEWLEKTDKNNRQVYPTEEDFYAYIEGEEGREWLIAVTITDDRFATLDGLSVGMTCEQAKELGYNLDEGQNSVGNAEYILDIGVENGVVVQMRNVWTLGRYIGKFFEL